MQLTLRPYVTAGVAIVGASVIAATPITAPPPAAEIQNRAVHLTAAVQNLDLPNPANTLANGAAIPDLGAILNPAALTSALEAYIQLFADTALNIQGRIGQGVGQGAPILQQIIANQVGYGETLITGLQTAAENLISSLTGGPNGLVSGIQQAIDQLMAGQFDAAVSSVYQGLVGTVIGVGFALLPALQIPVQMAQNFANVVAAVVGVPVSLGFNALSTTFGLQAAFGDIGQGIIEAVTGGDPAAALGILVGAPAVLAGALLNGYNGSGYGLLGPNGVVSAILNVRDTIAGALGAGDADLLSGFFSLTAEQTAPESAGSELAAANKVPAATGAAVAATTVAVMTDPEAPPADANVAVAGGTEGTPAAETPPVTPVEDETDETNETDEGTEETNGNTGSEESEESNESESPNGATDLGDGNKAEPDDDTTGSGEDSGSTSDDESESSADGTTGDDTEAGGTSNNANTDSGDSSTGGGGSENGSDGGSES